MIKKVLLVFACISIIFTLAGCKHEQDSDDKRVTEAIADITEVWEDTYDTNTVSYSDKYVEIIHTRVINIKDEIDTKASKFFGDIDYIVEFQILSNYLNTAPYYQNVGTNNCVVVYKDGTKKFIDMFRNYFSITFDLAGTSEIIESIEDFGDKYNQVLDIK